MLKAPPKFVTSIGAWEYTLAKLKNKQDEDGKRRVDDYGNPLNYAAAVAIYKNVVKKYPAFQIATHGPDAIPEFHLLGYESSTGLDQNVNDLDDAYPVGSLFWYDDVLCEAIGHHVPDIAIYSNSEGKLFIRGRVLDVDPEGAHKDWDEGHEDGFPPHRCSTLIEGAVRV